MTQQKRFFLNSVFSIALVLFTLGCSNDNRPETGNLQAYLETSSTMINELIACAAGGSSNVLASPSHPVSIFFLPEGHATNFRYFETENIAVANDDFSAYSQVDLNDVPVFGGFLRYFEREAIQTEKWGIVTYENNGAIHYSNPIRIKFSEKPTEANNSLLSLDQTEPLSPRFTWKDGLIPENAIYFHVITGPDGNLLSGTYTFAKTWQFYDLSNVVLNIRDITPPPALSSNNNYQYTMLAVSLDNWVNLIIQRDFNTF
ncbi:hypothetical protein [Roseivirga sp. E12]|uniref:hypothetical protein n=1 Tax=Roseivirga sp. E12 TaxID=2819237 RepID=UPI001ABC3A36|nr:hypothetical protein [Roseivirga sp. E12]MBO3698163.1 hypothetical protein [Roseivirga sp. E12]